MRARQWMQIAAVASAVGLAGTAFANDVDRASTGDSAVNAAAQLDRDTAPRAGTTQGGTMVSPRPVAAPSGHVPSGGEDRLGNTNSENFDQRMSDYAAQHDGRITRQQFLDEMGHRFDIVDAQRQGSLTPDEVREVLTPGEDASVPTGADEGARAPTGSDVRPGETGPGAVTGE